MLGQDTGGNVVDLANELEHRIIRKLLEREFTLGHVAGVGLPQDGVTVARNNTASVQGGPEVIFNGLVTEVVADSFLHLTEPVQDFLVGQSVEGTSKTVQTSSKGEHRGAESRSDQVGGVSRNITTLLRDISVGSFGEWSREITYVIRMDNKVQPHQIDEILVPTKAELVRQVVTVVLVLFNRRNLSIFEDIAVDFGSNGGELGNKVHGVLESVTPVFLLINTLSVGLRELGLVLKSSHGN